jgi:hypothetical protein
MKTSKVRTFLCAIAICSGAEAGDKPRVFITESGSLQLSGDASIGNVKGSLFVVGGTSPQIVEVLKSFSRRCPGVMVTADRDRADYIVRFDHEPAGPTTPFVRGNKVAVFNKDLDLVFSGSTRFLNNAVRDACGAIAGRTPK